LDEGSALQVAADPDGVECDIQSTDLLYDCIEMLLDGLGIEGIDLSGPGAADAGC
jgi:hypothetical protein